MSVQLNSQAIHDMFADPDGPVGQAMEKVAIQVEDVAKSLLMLPGTGGIYMPGVLSFVSGGKFYSNWSTGGRSDEHTASAPGEPPASDTGALLTSVGHEMHVGETVYALIGSSKEYAIYLEEGTHRRGGEVGIEARPWLVPALHIVVPE